MIASDILKQLTRFNSEILETLKLTTEVALERGSIPAETTLNALANQGIQDPYVAPLILSILLEHLEKQTEFPVLLAVDDFQALYNQSAYRDPLYHLVQSYHLSMPRAILEYASGLKSFARGAVVGALSTTNSSYPVPIELKDALGQASEQSSNVWAKRNPDLVTYASGLTSVPVPAQFTVHEAAAMIEVWEHSETLHTKFTESAFMAKLAESSGNPREFLHRGYLSTLVTW